MNKLLFASLLTAVSITLASSAALASESGEQKILKFGFARGTLQGYGAEVLPERA